MDMLDSYLRKSGVTSAVVDFGGSILTIGKDNGNSRRISITADETNTPVGTLTVDEGYIATSNGANRCPSTTLWIRRVRVEDDSFSRGGG